jgi:hypothetical protein
MSSFLCELDGVIQSGFFHTKCVCSQFGRSGVRHIGNLASEREGIAIYS